MQDAPTGVPLQRCLCVALSHSRARQKPLPLPLLSSSVIGPGVCTWKPLSLGTVHRDPPPGHSCPLPDSKSMLHLASASHFCRLINATVAGRRVISGLPPCLTLLSLPPHQLGPSVRSYFGLLQNGGNPLLEDVKSCPHFPTKDKSLQNFNKCNLKSESLI